MKKQKKIPYLDYEAQVGETVQWDNIKGEKFVGTLISMDEHCLAKVELFDGTIVSYQC